MQPWSISPKSGEVYSYKIEHGKIKQGNRSKRSVCSEVDLYKLKSDSPFTKDSQSVEGSFFQKIDANASLAHQDILSQGLSFLSVERKQAFALFIASLLYRHPIFIRELQRKVRLEMFSFSQNDLSVSSCLKSLKEKDVGLDLAALSDNESLRLMMSYIKEASVEIMGMVEWRLVGFSDENEVDFFVTADSPVVVNAGQGYDANLGCLTLPLSPKKMLVLVPSDDWLDDDLPLHMAMLNNVFLMKQADVLITHKKLTNDGFIKYDKALGQLFKNKSYDQP